MLSRYSLSLSATPMSCFVSYLVTYTHTLNFMAFITNYMFSSTVILLKEKKIKYLFGRADYTSKCILGIFDTSTSKFPGGSDGEASAYNAGDSGSIPRLGRSPGEGNGTPLQYSCL